MNGHLKNYTISWKNTNVSPKSNESVGRQSAQNTYCKVNVMVLSDNRSVTSLSFRLGLATACCEEAYTRDIHILLQSTTNTSDKLLKCKLMCYRSI